MATPGFDLTDMCAAISTGRVEWHRHALERMFERAILREDVLEILSSGERIEDYPDDFPFPSALFLGWVENRPLHAVAAYNAGREAVGVITVYEPTLDRFEEDFRTRKRDNV